MQHLIMDCVIYWNKKKLRNLFTIVVLFLITYTTNIEFQFVVDLRVTQQRCGQFPRCVRSLPQCLGIYLNLPANLIYHPQIHDGYIVLESQQWNKRPLPIELEIGAVKNSVFLLQLQEKICKELLRPFYHCVDVFLGVVKDSDQPEDREHQANDAKAPLELLSLYDQPQMAVDNRHT